MTQPFARFDTLRARIVVAGVAVLAGFIPVAWIAIGALSTISNTVAQELSLLRRVAGVTGAITAAVYDEARAGEQYLVTPSPDIRQRFSQSAAAVYAAQRQLSALTTLSQAERAAITRAATLQAQVEVGYHYAHALEDLGRRAAALQAASAARGPAESLIAAVRTITSSEATRSQRTAATLEATANRDRSIVWVVLVVTILVGGGIGLALFRLVDRPIVRLVAAARRFGEGDLRPARLGAMPHELAALADAMDRIGRRFRDIIGEVVTESERIANTAGDLSAVSEELAATAGEITTAMVDISGGAERQVSGLEEGRSAVDRLGATAGENRTVAGRVAELGSEIDRLATRHQSDVASAAKALADVQRIVEKGAVQVEELERLSVAIEDFVDLIKRISSQTNLLALNAAIEAARAGERGLGFAVVAEEVRQLADSSAEAAQEVTETVRAVRSKAADAVAVMADGRARVSGVGGVAEGAAAAFLEIVRAVKEVEQAARRVAEEAGTNLKAAEDVSSVLRGVADAASTHASSAQEVTAAAEEQGASTEEMAAQANELTQAAERLRHLVEGFTI